MVSRFSAELYKRFYHCVNIEEDSNYSDELVSHDPNLSSSYVFSQHHNGKCFESN